MSKRNGFVRAFARGYTLLLFSITALPTSEGAFAGGKEPLAVIELGVGSEWGLNGTGASVGPSASVELTPIPNWLVVEPGVQTLFHHGQTEWDTSLIFKKPFDILPTVEFEPGLGPVWMHTAGSGKTIVGAEFVAEFMFWPTRDRKFGWFLEPSYSYSFGKDHEQSLGVSVGLLVPLYAGGRP
jgi:hypothetical protein